MEDMIARMFVAALGFVLGLAGYFAVVEFCQPNADAGWREWVIGFCLQGACVLIVIGCAWLFVHSAIRL